MITPSLVRSLSTNQSNAELPLGSRVDPWCLLRVGDAS